MSKRETLTESMRRYSNIVTEAEQLDENIFRFILKMLSKGARHSSQGRLDDVNAIARSFRSELGNDPDEWADKVKFYFDDLRQETKPGLIDKFGDQGNIGPGKKILANQQLDRVDRELTQLANALARFSRDPYDLDVSRDISKSAAKAMAELRTIPGASASDDLKKLYQQMVDLKKQNRIVDVARNFFALYMTILAMAVAASMTVDHIGAAKDGAAKDGAAEEGAQD